MFEVKSGFDVRLFLPQIPEEEKNLGPQDRLIHVYHFTKDATQNQMVNKLWNYGHFFPTVQVSMDS